MSKRERKGSSKLSDEVTKDFKAWQYQNPDAPIAVAAIHALTKVVERSKATTLMELQEELKESVGSLKSMKPTSISLGAGCELFSRYVTRTSLDITEFSACRAKLIERGKNFAESSMDSRSRVTKFGDRFIQDGSRILIHGRSSVVSSLLIHAQKRGKNFSVFITEGRPDYSGYLAATELQKAGLEVSLILDSAVGTTMGDVDMVVVGAEGVVENGGIINKVGTYQIAMVASLLKKPLYVAAESYKFARLFPLSQKDVPQPKGAYRPIEPPSESAAISLPKGVPFINPSCDYTPPKFITLLFTDLGILTPSAISDELIKLYY